MQNWGQAPVKRLFRYKQRHCAPFGLHSALACYIAVNLVAHTLHNSQNCVQNPWAKNVAIFVKCVMFDPGVYLLASANGQSVPT